MLDIKNITPSIGAEISGVDLRNPLSDGDAGAIYQTFLDRKVIVFRDQPLTPDQQLEFSRLFGTMAAHPVNRVVGDAEVGVQIIDVGTTKARGVKHTDQWHSDVTFLSEPYKGAVLKAEILPSSGGDTLWSNLNAVYEGLPPEIQRAIENLDARHGWPLDSSVTPGSPDHYSGVVHPMVRVHPETGLRSVFVNETYTRNIVGMSRSESAHVLGLIFDGMKVPETQLRHHWEPHSIVVWDNRCTAHYATFDYSERRVMHRVTLAGERPLPVNERPSA